MTPAYTAGRNDAANDMDAAMASDDDGLLRDVAWNEISGDSQNPMEKL